MAFSWFRVDSSVVDHPKVMELAARLQEPLALAYVIRLWSWVQRYAPDGRIRAAIVPQLEAFLGAPIGGAGRIQTMADLGLLDSVSDGFLVHDWPEFQGALVEKSKRDAKIKRLKRRIRGAETARAGREDGASAPPLRDETRRDTTRRDGKKDRAATASPPDPRHAPLVKDLVTLAPGYVFAGGRDAKAVTAMLAMGTDDEIKRRWLRARAHTGFPQVRTLYELAQHWNHFSPKETRGGSSEEDRKWFEENAGKEISF